MRTEVLVDDEPQVSCGIGDDGHLVSPPRSAPAVLSEEAVAVVAGAGHGKGHELDTAGTRIGELLELRAKDRVLGVGQRHPVSLLRPNRGRWFREV